MSALTRYGDWTIGYDPPPFPGRNLDWFFVHVDHDAEWTGDGWADNGLSGQGCSLTDCVEQIEEIEATHEHFRTASPLGVDRTRNPSSREGER